MKISDINFDIPVQQIIERQGIPLKFRNKTFGCYKPCDKFPSQAKSMDLLINTVQQIEKFNKPFRCKWIVEKFVKIKKPKNIYIDGSFGVGKTHLLAACGNLYTERSFFLSFSELMYLIAFYSVQKVVDIMSKYNLILLDEFELDDPGDAMMGINFLKLLNKTGSSLITTSNTLPSDLGRNRFDTILFSERIGNLVNSFDLTMINGEDYRLTQKTEIVESEEPDLERLYKQYILRDKKAVYVNSEKLFSTLRTIHPVRYMNLYGAVDALFINNLQRFDDDNLLDLLRFSFLIDIIYYADISIFISTRLSMEELIADDLMNGPFKNKISRTMSRIAENGKIFHIKGNSKNS